MAASVVLALLWELTALSNPLAGFKGPLRGGEKRGQVKERRGKE